MRPCKFISHVLSPEQAESEPFVSEERQRVGKIEVVIIFERVDKLEGSFTDIGPGSDLDVEFSGVGVVEVVEFVLFGSEVVLWIWFCLLYHLNYD